MCAEELPGAAPNRVALLGEILREAERVLDHQVRALDTLDDKVEQMLTLSVGVLLGAFALAAFLAERANPWRAYAAALAAGGLWNVTAVVRFARAYGVVDREIEAQVGPDSYWLVERAQDTTWAAEAHAAQVLGAIHNSIEANGEMAAFVSQERARGMRWLLAALTLYAAVIALFVLLGDDVQGGV